MDSFVFAEVDEEVVASGIQEFEGIEIKEMEEEDKEGGKYDNADDGLDKFESNTNRSELSNS